jgi:hypothetical protein
VRASLWCPEPVFYSAAVVVNSVVVAKGEKGFHLHAARSPQTYLTVLKWDKCNKRIGWCVSDPNFLLPQILSPLVIVFVWVV